MFREYVLESRNTEEVIKDHLRLRQGGHTHVDEDIKRNFSDSITVKTNFGEFQGKNGVKRCASILKKQLPCGKYKYKKVAIEGNTAKLWWSGDCEQASVDNGYDVFTIKDGKIVKQNIYYTVKKK